MSANFLNDFEILEIRYTQAQAIEDGVLSIIPEKISRAAGFAIPILATAAVIALMEPSKLGKTQYGQSFDARAWDVLHMLFLEVRRTLTDEVSTLTFKVILLMGKRQEERTLKAVCAGDDNGAPCITVLLPEES